MASKEKGLKKRRRATLEKRRSHKCGEVERREGKANCKTDQKLAKNDDYAYRSFKPKQDLFLTLTKCF